MSNAKRLAISPLSFVGVLEQLGARFVEQSGFIRVEGPEGRRMYVGRGRITATVHLSGFTTDYGTRALEKSPSSKVTQEMDWPEGITAVEQLRLFADLYRHMMTLDAAPRKASSPASSAPAPQLIDASLVLAEV